MLFVVALGMMVETASANTILQTIVDDDKRRRMMSFYYTTAFMGMTPFSSLLAGQMASRIGAPLTVMVDGIFILLFFQILYDTVSNTGFT